MQQATRCRASHQTPKGKPANALDELHVSLETKTPWTAVVMVGMAVCIAPQGRLSRLHCVELAGLAY
jgi:hypothetical protein